jgi:hypothetical protein
VAPALGLLLRDRDRPLCGLFAEQALRRRIDLLVEVDAAEMPA